MVSNDVVQLMNVENISIHFAFQNRNVTLLKEVSFSVNQGEILGITGFSGSGKSLTALSMMGLVSHFDHLDITGSIRFNGIDILKAGEKSLAKLRGHHISMVIQQPMDAFNPVVKIGNQLREAVIIHHPKISKNQVGQCVEKILEEVGLMETDRFLNAYPHELSGGQLQRMAIAMAIINDPQLLILDEPTSSLDSLASSEINELFKRLTLKRGLTLVYISHDLEIMKTMCHRIIILQHGKVSDEIDLSKESLNPILPRSMNYLDQKIKSFDRTVIHDETKTKLKLVNISKAYQTTSFFGLNKKQLNVLKNVNVKVRDGEMVGIVGPSGSGKSTLMNIISGLISSDSGSLYLNDNIYDKALIESNTAIRKKIQMVLQNALSSLQPKMTIKQQWLEVLKLYQTGDKSYYHKILVDWIEDTGLTKDVLEKFPSQLSGGQQQRAALVRSLLVQPEVVIFDESLSALDIWHQNLMLELIVKLQDKYKFAGLFITHDHQLATAICHKIITITDGNTLSKN
jgi:ABC-type glutathione transport system ATPase component